MIQGVETGGLNPVRTHDATTALLDRMADPEPAVRARVAQALWMIALIWRGAPRLIELDAVAAAMHAATTDRDDNVRLAAVRGLGVVGQRLSEDPPPGLLVALADGSEAVRGAAGQALIMYPHGLARLLPSLVKSLEAARPECRPAYLGVLKQVGLSMSRRESAPAQELIAALVAGIGSRDREVRCQILSVIGEFRHEARPVIPTLLAILDEPGDADGGGVAVRCGGR